ncbi:MAG: type II toxin-antitoxin system RelE/ParE family toxin [Candidatus Kapabacteria bacterium]|nr:type II toxin-antitoxin system RelE/ParE family toxin [Candidatus Kapabacteria bacterium]
MDREVVWSKGSIDDIERILEYLQQGSLRYAQTFLLLTRKSAVNLQQFPYKGRVVPEFDSHTIREVFIDSYRMIYQVTDTNIQILTIIHSARNLSDLINPIL